jgi:hypothetical protein
MFKRVLYLSAAILALSAGLSTGSARAAKADSCAIPGVEPCWFSAECSGKCVRYHCEGPTCGSASDDNCYRCE